MNLVKNLLGGIVIMLVATLIGVAQNAARSKPMTLFPKLPKTAENKIPLSSGNDAVGGTEAGESTTPVDMSAPTVTEAEIADGEIVMERVKTVLEAG